MVFKKITGLFGGAGNDEETQVLTRALTVHGLNEYNETAQELKALKKAVKKAPTRSQKEDAKKLRDRVQCRQDALRSAAAVLFNRLDGAVEIDINETFGITEQDIAKVSAGIANNRQNPAQEVVQFLIEEAQSDFISGRV